MSKDISKLAAQELRRLDAENKELKEKLASFQREKEASEVVDALISNGAIDNKARTAKILELTKATDDEFKITKHASILMAGSPKIGIGKLEDNESTNVALDPMTAALMDYNSRKNGA